MQVSKKIRLSIIAAIVLLGMLNVNLILLQYENLQRSRQYLANKDSYNALFFFGQCLRQAVPLSPFTSICADSSIRLLPEHPEMRGYIVGALPASARFGEANPGMTLLLHLGFVGFIGLMLLQARRNICLLRKWRSWWVFGTLISLVLWLGMGWSI
jgi:hypothetical protein